MKRAEKKKQSHQRILDAASRQLAQAGIAGTGVDAVMADAGLTHGGFYAHFDNKQAMVEEALTVAQERLADQLTKGMDEYEGREAVLQMLARYIGRPHRDRPEEGCLLPVLMGEASRGSEELRKSVEAEVDNLARIFAGRLQNMREAEDLALGLVALAAGGVALSRAVADEEMSDRILRGARILAHHAIR